MLRNEIPLGGGSGGQAEKYNGRMSFYCPWQDGQFETCRRTGDTKCLPGKPGCVLFGKVAFAEDVPERRAPSRKKKTSHPAASSVAAAHEARAGSREDLLLRLERFPSDLAEVFRRPRDWASPCTPQGWSAAQIIHHLADVHAAGLLRVRRALCEDSPTVDPYDHERWANLPDAVDPELVRASLAIIEGVHARWAALLRGQPDSAWARCYRHPELGRELTIEEDLAWHVQHGEDHLRRLA